MLCFLKERATQLTELADAPDCDVEKLYNTYTQFKFVNLLFSHWRSVYELYIRPLLQEENRTLTLLDIGCGGGDIALTIAEWAARDDLSLEITAIDPDIRAINFVNSLDNPHNVRFQCASTKDLVAQNRSFDVVISNHLIHHLSTRELHEFMAEAKQLANKIVIFNDIERSDPLYICFSLLTLLTKPFFSDSFIWIDGPRSIQRSYTQSELSAIAAEDWQVKRLLFSRLLLIYSK